MGQFLSVLGDVVLGRCCVGCSTPGPLWCPRCAAEVVPEPRDFGRNVWAAGVWGGRRRDAILAWKLGHVTELDNWCAWQLAAAVVALDPTEPFALLPVPSTRRAKRERGRSLVRDLAVGAAVTLSAVGVDVVVADGVRLARQPADQSALGRSGRVQNLAGSMRLDKVPQRPVVLVDDIVTTGATLAEMSRAVGDAGVRMLGAAALAAAGDQSNATNLWFGWSPGGTNR